MIVSHIGHNQLASYLLYHANQFYKTNSTQEDIILFFQNIAKPEVVPVFPLMNISEIYNYTGTGIATSLETASKLLNAPGPSDRYLYLWDLEWLHGVSRSFESYLSIYSDPRLKFIARNQRQAAEFERCWNRPIKGVVDNCDLKVLMGIVRDPKQRGT